MNMARRSPLRAVKPCSRGGFSGSESSNPPVPASQCGLPYSISGCARTADIPAGYAGAPMNPVMWPLGVGAVRVETHQWTPRADYGPVRQFGSLGCPPLVAREAEGDWR